MVYASSPGVGSAPFATSLTDPARPFAISLIASFINPNLTPFFFKKKRTSFSLKNSLFIFLR